VENKVTISSSALVTKKKVNFVEFDEEE